MDFRAKARAVKAWLKAEGQVAAFYGGNTDATVIYDGVPRWKRLLRLPGKWIWRERDWLIKAAIGGIGVLIGKYLLK
jgi:hypothetical protein